VPLLLLLEPALGPEQAANPNTIAEAMAPHINFVMIELLPPAPPLNKLHLL
jgi:hypothetical protein